MPGWRDATSSASWPASRDYIDSDDTLTLNGAERYDYDQRGAPAPAQLDHVEPPGARPKVLGVGELLTPAQWRRLWPVLTMRPVFGYNFNTMRPEVLAAVLDLDEQAVRGVLEEREKRSISRLTTVALLSGIHLDIDEMEIRNLPSRFLRISVWHEGDGSRILTGIHLTPLGEIGALAQGLPVPGARSGRPRFGSPP